MSVDTARWRACATSNFYAANASQYSSQSGSEIRSAKEMTGSLNSQRSEIETDALKNKMSISTVTEASPAILQDWPPT